MNFASADRPDAAGATETAPLVESDDPQRHLPSLYRIATDLQVTLENAPGGLKTPDAPLTPAHVGSFNQLLSAARALLPDSVALREDVGEVDENTRRTDAHHALRTTIVPTLHNALPDPVYDKTG
jgi:hypothetical protein